MGTARQFGGKPAVFRDAAVTTSGRKHLLRAASLELRITTTGFPVRIFFLEDDFNANENYIEIPVGEVFQMALQVREVWMKGVGGNASVEMVSAMK